MIMACNNVKTSRGRDFHPIPAYIWVFDVQHMQTASPLATPHAVVQRAASRKDKNKPLQNLLISFAVSLQATPVNPDHPVYVGLRVRHVCLIIDPAYLG